MLLAQPSMHATCETLERENLNVKKDFHKSGKKIKPVYGARGASAFPGPREPSPAGARWHLADLLLVIKTVLRHPCRTVLEDFLNADRFSLSIDLRILTAKPFESFKIILSPNGPRDLRANPKI
jgi:hypothetical protein